MHATPASEAGVVALLAAVVVGLLMLVSADSYLHDLFDHVDSAWYYICGKAWMNGMTPYVDFADSKGPMLWLIYGVGYLLSPRDYTGVFWLTCLSYTITYWLNYRTAWLLTGSRRWGIVVSLLMSLGYFYPILHEEIKSEDFAQLWVALALYATCRLALGDRKQLKPTMIALGVSMAMTLMIKYSFTAMLSIFAIYSLIIVWRRRYGIAAAMGWGIAGAAIVLVPWAIYMLAVGIFDDFVQEYFINTLTTVGALSDDMGGYSAMLGKLTLHKLLKVLPVMLAVSALAGMWALPRLRWLPLVSTVWFFVLTTFNAWWRYYYVIDTWAFIWLLIAIAVACQQQGFKRVKSWAVALIAVAAVLVPAFWSLYLNRSNFFISHHPGRDAYYRYARLMAQVPNPMVIYWGACAVGYETPVGGLPGCKYWSEQNGATPEMKENQWQAVVNNQADFVFVNDADHAQRLEALGYNKWYLSPGYSPNKCDDVDFTLYTKHQLTPIDTTLTVAPLDIVLKRWPF